MTIAEQFIERGMEKGMQAGLAKGRSEGRLEGHSEGRSEERREGMYRVAKKLLAAGVDLALIADTTGLSQADLQLLKQKEEV